MSFSDADAAYMRRALALAEMALGATEPNPRVGCVIVNNGHIVGAGQHLRAGEPHAEAHALRAAGERARGATCYVTLEPCNHHGRTPPCSEALLRAGVKRVVVAMRDGDSRARGGLEHLRAAGVEVHSGLLAQAARELNIGFHQRWDSGRPWLRLKLATSIDHRIAAADGSSQWITGAAARRDAQYWRARASVIVTSAGTVRADNPRLNVRLPQVGRQPARLVISRSYDVDPAAALFTPPGMTRVYGLTPRTPDAARRYRALVDAGHQVLEAPEVDGQIDLQRWLRQLGSESINEVHAECGADLAGRLLTADVVDEIIWYLAPKWLGDRGLPAAVLPGLQRLDQALNFQLHSSRPVGDDLRIILRRRGLASRESD